MRLCFVYDFLRKTDRFFRCEADIDRKRKTKTTGGTKKMKKIISVILVILMAATLLVACGEKPTTGDQQTGDLDPASTPLGICIVNRTNPTVQLMIGGFVDAAKKLGYTDFHIYAPDDADVAEAYSLAEAGIDQHGIKGMVLFWLDDSAETYAEAWREKGVFVTSAHQFFDASEEQNYPGLNAWAAASAAVYGATAAEAMGKELNGEGLVAITEGSFNLTEDTAAKAFTEYMNEKYPNIKVLAPQEEGYDTPTAIAKATSIIQSNPGINGAFSTTGTGGSTWAGAIKNTGVKMCAIGVDYNETNLDLVKNGEIYGIIAQPLYEEFYAATEYLDKLLKGEKVDWANIIDAPLVTKDNVEEYYELTKYVNDIMATVY